MKTPHLNMNFLHQQLNHLSKRFDHSRRIMNYIHLMHWFLGEFFYSKDLNHCFTSFWIKLSISNNVIFFLITLSYLFFTPNPGITNILYGYNAIMINIYLGILTPLATFICGKSTSKVFQILDKKFTPFPNREYYGEIEFIRQEEYPMEIVHNLLILHFTSWFGYFIATTLYFIIGDSESKLHDPVSYLYPIYCEMIQSLAILFVVNFIQFLIVIPDMVINVVEPFHLVLIAREFYTKFLLVSNSIKNQSRLFVHRYEKLLANCTTCSYEGGILEETFIRDIHTYVKYHEQLLRSVSYFKPFLELTTSICIIVLMNIEVILLCIYIYTEDDSLMFKMKNMNYGLLFYSLFFVACFTGKLFSDMEDLFRETIYDIPWYYLSPSNRKYLNLLLYRAHIQIKFKALKVYPINMHLFLRFSQQVYSVTNVLNRATERQ